MRDGAMAEIDDATEANDPAPAWCVQPEKLPADSRGCRGSEEFDGREIARDAWGDMAQDMDSGLIAFAYLWRRFGPPRFGSDPRKELCRYIIGTPDPRVFLEIGPKAMDLTYSVGYIAKQEVLIAIGEPRRRWFERMAEWGSHHGHANYTALCKSKDAFKAAIAELGDIPIIPEHSQRLKAEGPLGEFTRALFAAAKEMLRPVYVRDVSINILGRVDDDDPFVGAGCEESRYAGLGIPTGPLEALLVDD